MSTDLHLRLSVRRSTLVAFATGALLTLGLAAGLSWAAPAQVCAKGLFCFAPDSPALAGEVNGNFAAVAVGVGSIIAHTTNLAGSETVLELQARGFALCDGTTPASQGITDAIITAATPNLNGGRFLRGGNNGQSGTLEDDATSANGLTLNDPARPRDDDDRQLQRHERHLVGGGLHVQERRGERQQARPLLGHGAELQLGPLHDGWLGHWHHAGWW